MRILFLLPFLLIASLLSSQEIIGIWNGILDIQGTKLRIVFHVAQDGDTLRSTMDSPDQGAKGIPTTSTTYENNMLRITATSMQMTYQGNLSSDGKNIIGAFKQGPMAIPLNLGREDIIVNVTNPRQQEPSTKDYDEEEVTFTNAIDGHKLAGTFSFSDEYDHIAILISGSGPQNRDSDLGPMNHRPFLVLSDFLTTNGIAVLRYDDRGVGESEGDRSNATSYDYAEDTKAAVKYLRTRSDTKDKKIGLIGHSEGGLIAPIVATELENEVDFISLLAGPGIYIKDLMTLQADRVMESAGQSKDMRRINAELLSEAYDILLKNKNASHDEIVSKLTTVFDAHVTQLFAESNTPMGNPDVFVRGQVMSMSNTWFRYFIDFKPGKYLDKVSCPILAINGSLDTQVTAKENLAGIKEATTSNPQVTIKEIPYQNHLFQVCRTGSPSEYGEIEETFNEATMELIAEWIKMVK